MYLPQIILKIASLNTPVNTKQTQQSNTKKDEIAPFPPRLDSLPSATAKNDIAISGYTEPRASIKLYRNDSFLKTATADREGIFTFENVALVKGENAFYATAVDAAGNESKNSNSQTVNFKTEGPTLAIEAVTDTETGLATIQGSTSPDAKVTVNGRRIVVNRGGSFSEKYKLQPGENSFEAVAVDSAGNESRQVVSVTYSPED